MMLNHSVTLLVVALAASSFSTSFAEEPSSPCNPFLNLYLGCNLEHLDACATECNGANLIFPGSPTTCEEAADLCPKVTCCSRCAVLGEIWLECTKFEEIRGGCVNDETCLADFKIPVSAPAPITFAPIAFAPVAFAPVGGISPECRDESDFYAACYDANFDACRDLCEAVSDDDLPEGPPDQCEGVAPFCPGVTCCPDCAFFGNLLLVCEAEVIFGDSCGDLSCGEFAPVVPPPITPFAPAVFAPAAPVAFAPVGGISPECRDESNFYFACYDANFDACFDLCTAVSDDDLPDGPPDQCEGVAPFCPGVICCPDCAFFGNLLLVCEAEVIFGDSCGDLSCGEFAPVVPPPITPFAPAAFAPIAPVVAPINECEELSNAYFFCAYVENPVACSEACVDMDNVEMFGSFETCDDLTDLCPDFVCCPQCAFFGSQLLACDIRFNMGGFIPEGCGDEFSCGDDIVPVPFPAPISPPAPVAPPSLSSHSSSSDSKKGGKRDKKGKHGKKGSKNKKKKDKNGDFWTSHRA